MKKPTYNELVALVEDCLAELETSLDTRLGMGEHPQSGDLYDLTQLCDYLPNVIKAAKSKRRQEQRDISK